jgi:hypothetical protein
MKLILIITLMLASPIHSQVVRREPPWSILRQAKGSVSAGRKEAVADSLVQIVTGAHPGVSDSVKHMNSMAAIAALISAGSPVTSEPGTPYAPAINRLIAAHRAAPVGKARPRAV